VVGEGAGAGGGCGDDARRSATRTDAIGTARSDRESHWGAALPVVPAESAVLWRTVEVTSHTATRDTRDVDEHRKPFDSLASTVEWVGVRFDVDEASGEFASVAGVDADPTTEFDYLVPVEPLE
jgi:hypothetical protein